MLIISIWHESLAEVSNFANDCDLASALVTLVPDTEMRHSFWGVYRVPTKKYRELIATPRLTWK